MSARLLLSLATAVLALTLGSNARAIPYSDCIAATVAYTGIAEFSAEGPLYNAPTCDVPNDHLDFNPLGFEANPGAGTPANPNPDFTDGNLVFTVSAADTFLIDNLVLDENGDRQVFDLASNGADTSASVDLIVRLEIVLTPVGGGSFPLDYIRQTSLVFDPTTSFGVWSIHEEFLMTAIFAEACTGTGYFIGGAVPQACGATTTRVGVNIDNKLFAYEESGDLAFINKKDADGFTFTTETEPVPEPATGALLALGLAVISAARRRHA